MQTRGSYQFGGSSNNPFKGLMGIAVAIFFFIALFWFMQFLFNLLWMALPVIIIATVIIDYKLILNYFGWVGRIFKSNWLAGLLVGVLTMVGAPIVASFLLGKALLKKKVNKIHDEVKRHQEGEFVNYEEVESEILDLPRIEIPTPKEEKGSDYDEMFK